MAIVGFRHVGLKVVSDRAGRAAVAASCRASRSSSARCAFRWSSPTSRRSSSSSATRRPSSTSACAARPARWAALSRASWSRARPAHGARRAAPVSPDRADVRAPFGVDVVQVTPASIALSSSLVRQDRAGRACRSKDEPAEGFMVGHRHVRTRRSRGRGSGERARSADASAVTEAVSVDGRHQHCRRDRDGRRRRLPRCVCAGRRRPRVQQCRSFRPDRLRSTMPDAQGTMRRHAHALSYRRCIEHSSLGH